MQAGLDFIGVGVGAMIFNDEGKVFMSLRGLNATNEKGTWEFPGGKVEFGESLKEAIRREILEEYGMEIEVLETFTINDHILLDERQHWISPTFIARFISGEPNIQEPEKCSAIGWFSLEDLPVPLSAISQMDLSAYQKIYLDKR